MSRDLPEWVGRDDSTTVPARVKARLRERQPICAHCELPINDSYRKPTFDHIVALINWSQEGHGNRETNLQILCEPCHRLKTQVDVAVKASHARRIKKRYGLQKKTRPMPGTKASGLRKRMNGTVEPW